MKNVIDINSVIELFEHHARQLDQQSNATSLEAAIALLASWMTQEQQWLTEADLGALTAVGGILFKEQLGRRVHLRTSQDRKSA